MKQEKQLTVTQLRKMFPDDDACLEHIFRARYGETLICSGCEREAKYYRVKKRRAHECEHCGFQVYATAGTPFDKTRTPLTVWFHVMHMFCTTRNGVSAKEIQRLTGVTYKTAWRMGHEIRKYMAQVDGDAPLGGSGGGAVEVDKAFLGGHDKIGRGDKAVVLGMVERGGEVILRHVQNRMEGSVAPHILKWVKPNSRVMTDEARPFQNLGRDFDHHTVNHAAKEYVRGPVHTNTIEAVWANLKRGISGTHVWVSKKHLSKYLGEFEFRHNLRDEPHLMMKLLLRAFPMPVARRAPSHVRVE